RSPLRQRAGFPLVHPDHLAGDLKAQGRSPSAFSSCAIFSSRASTWRLFNPAIPLSKNVSRQADKVAAFTFSSRDNVSKSSPLNRRRTASVFFFADQRPRSMSFEPEFLLRIRTLLWRGYFPPKLCPRKF